MNQGEEKDARTHCPLLPRWHRGRLPRSVFWRGCMSEVVRRGNLCPPKSRSPVVWRRERRGCRPQQALWRPWKGSINIVHQFNTLIGSGHLHGRPGGKILQARTYQGRRMSTVQNDVDTGEIPLDGNDLLRSGLHGVKEPSEMCDVPHVHIFTFRSSETIGAKAYQVHH